MKRMIDWLEEIVEVKKIKTPKGDFGFTVNFDKDRNYLTINLNQKTTKS